MTGLRAVLASAIATLRNYRRYPGQLIGLLVWPVLLPSMYILQARAFTGGSAAATAAFVQRTGVGSVAGFLFVGFAVYMWLSIVLWGPGTWLRQQQLAGQLEALFLTPASRAAILFGPSVAYIPISAVMFAFVGAVLRIFFGVDVHPSEAIRAAATILFAIPSMVGLGALFALAVLIYKEANGLVQGLRGAFQVFCGMTFPIVVLPAWARAVAIALPPTYMLRDIRAALLAGASLAELGPDLLVLAGLGVVLAAVAMLGFTAAERHARATGTLGGY